MAYDPQRNRARAQPAADEPAPVDMVLERVAPVKAVEAVEAAVDGREQSASVAGEPVEAHAHGPAHEHGPGHDHHEHGPDCDHGHGPDLRLIVAVGVATVAAAVLVLRRRRSARR